MRLPTPQPGDECTWVAQHLGHLCLDDPVPSPRFRGTQAAADAALAAFGVTGYAARRNEVAPTTRRGASGLSPWIRHGMLTLPQVWDAVEGPARDVAKFRDELLWQEYARHVYARLGTGNSIPIRFVPWENTAHPVDPWDRSMACVGHVVAELETDGWIVNQTRMWLASQWSVRSAAPWCEGEDRFFAHLLDGSRAANRLGWQWTIGAGTGKPYGFSRWQVRKRAPTLCRGCVHEHNCPIESWPPERELQHAADNALVHHDPRPEHTAGPVRLQQSAEPDVVWLTAESLGDADPALRAHADLPVAFVFDERLLARLRLSGKRLVFLTERLAELAQQRELAVHLGDPFAVLAGQPVATTFAPVPGWRTRARRIRPVALHPWPWLRRPHAGSIASFTAWSRLR